MNPSIMGVSFEQLPSPARYFPLERGKYEVAPGLKVLGTAFGNGPADSLVFQIDHEYPQFRESKRACREKDNYAKYFLTDEFSPEVENHVCEFIARRLALEHPSYFELFVKTDGWDLRCDLTGELLSSHNRDLGNYLSTFDALVNQVQEDIAITRFTPERQDWLSALHVCSPSHWAPEEKIGKNFIDVHAPVAGIEKVNAAAKGLVDASIHKGPYTRFVWSMATDRRLNHHPIAPQGIDQADWKGRSFRPEVKDNPFILRVERQITVPLPEVKASLFTIRVYFVEGEEIRRNPSERDLMKSAVLSMNEGHLKYKGLHSWRDELLRWLDG